MEIVGKGVAAGATDMAGLPVPTTAAKYDFDPYAKNRLSSSPFARNSDGSYVNQGFFREPRQVKATRYSRPSRAVHRTDEERHNARVEAGKKNGGWNKGLKMDMLPRVQAGKQYLATPKKCGWCGEEFSSRPNERVDAYRKRNFCSRSHGVMAARAAQRA